MSARLGNAGAMVLELTSDMAAQARRHARTGARSTPSVSACNGPLRVAIAGRVKAGKSTLLNALVGERLAPTDAGECTRIVSWYRRGPRYEVIARLRTGQEQALEFRRDDGALNVVLNGVPEADVQYLDVRWPASTLERVTLIDTPGLASLNDENSRRTREFLDHDGDHAPDADAVIYLMRHLHRSDVEFLDAFMDRSVAAASPGERGRGALARRRDRRRPARRDGLGRTGSPSATATTPSVRTLCATVVPMAGLLAETGLTLREDEAAALRALAATASRGARADAPVGRAVLRPARERPHRRGPPRRCSTASACTACASRSRRSAAGATTAATLGPEARRALRAQRRCSA